MNERIRQAARVLREGGVVAYPTDTLYGLAVDPRSPDAVTRLFTVKQRQHGQPIPLIAASEEQAAEVAAFNGTARRLGRAFWPGPLSLVLPVRGVICPDVTAADRTVAVRVPANETARALAAALGFCITATSANMSGQAPTASPEVVRAALGGRIDYLLDEGLAPGGAPSTIVQINGDEVTLVREGAVPWNRVLESLE